MYNQLTYVGVTGGTCFYLFCGKNINPFMLIFVSILLIMLVRQVFIQRKGEKSINNK